MRAAFTSCPELSRIAYSAKRMARLALRNTQYATRITLGARHDLPANFGGLACEPAADDVAGVLAGGVSGAGAAPGIHRRGGFPGLRGAADADHGHQLDGGEEAGGVFLERAPAGGAPV